MSIAGKNMQNKQSTNDLILRNRLIPTESDSLKKSEHENAEHKMNDN